MPALVAWLVSALGILFRSRIGGWIAQALLFFGLTVGVEHFAVAPLVQELRDYATGQITGALLSSLGILKFDICVSIILSAYGVKYAAAGARVFLHKRI